MNTYYIKIVTLLFEYNYFILKANLTRKYTKRCTNEEITVIDEYINDHNLDCAKAIFDNCIKTDSEERKNLIRDFSIFSNETEEHEMKMIRALQKLDNCSRDSLNKRDDDVTVSITLIRNYFETM